MRTYVRIADKKRVGRDKKQIKQRIDFKKIFCFKNVHKSLENEFFADIIGTKKEVDVCLSNKRRCSEALTK